MDGYLPALLHSNSESAFLSLNVYLIYTNMHGHRETDMHRNDITCTALCVFSNTMWRNIYRVAACHASCLFAL